MPFFSLLLGCKTDDIEPHAVGNKCPGNSHAQRFHFEAAFLKVSSKPCSFFDVYPQEVLALKMNKRIILLLLLCSLLQQGYCQNKLQRTIGTGSDDSGSLFKTGNNFLMVGSTKLNGSDEIYLASVDKNLDVTWSRSYGTSSGERGIDLVNMQNGNFLISGSGNNGSSSLLLEVDSGGKLIRSFGFGSFQDRLQKLITTNDNGFLNYGELEGAVSGNNKVSLIKYDEDLNIQWKYYYDYSGSTDHNSNFEMYARKALQLPNSSYILLGSYTEIYNASNNRKIRLIKVDENGNQEWVKGYHGGRMDNAFHMNLCADGGFIISATTNSYSSGDTDILLIKTDKLGNPEWLKTYGGKGQETAGQVMQLPNGDYVVCGSSNSFGFGKNDALLLKTDVEGNLLSARTYGGKEDDFAIKIDTLSNEFLISGNSESFGNGDKDVYIIRTDLSENSEDCSFDGTALLTESSVSTNFYEGSYSQGDFNTPSSVALNENVIVSFENTLCIDCPENHVQTVSLCSGESLKLDLHKDGAISYLWQDGSTEPTYFVHQEGVYWVDISTAHCNYRESFRVTEFATPSFDLGEDINICHGDTLLLDASINNAIGYQWQDGSTDSSVKIFQQGIYSVLITTECATLYDSIRVRMPMHDLFIPNAISPNNDGINDYFEILGGISQLTLKVVNRWGKLVYFSNSYNNDWNGGNLSSGVYYYLIEDKCLNQEYKGKLHILRRDQAKPS